MMLLIFEVPDSVISLRMCMGAAKQLQHSQRFDPQCSGTLVQTLAHALSTLGVHLCAGDAIHPCSAARVWH